MSIFDPLSRKRELTDGLRQHNDDALNARLAERRAQRIANELDVLRDMLAEETKLRDFLVSLGQPEGFKTTKMKYFEEQIEARLKLQSQQGDAS